jgi:hypothetical protein
MKVVLICSNTSCDQEVEIDVIDPTRTMQQLEAETRICPACRAQVVRERRQKQEVALTMLRCALTAIQGTIDGLSDPSDAELADSKTWESIYPENVVRWANNIAANYKSVTKG